MEHDPIRPRAEPISGSDSSAAIQGQDAAEDTDSPAARRRSLLGSFLLFLGIGLLGLLLIDPGALPLSMPRTWYIDRTLWVAGGLISFGAGWYLLRDGDTDAGMSGRAGAGSAATHDSRRFTNGLGMAVPRFKQIVLYTRRGCHLCDDALATLNRYSAYLPQPVEVDIDNDPVLIARFSTCVPVVEFDGKVRFRGRVNELLLRRLIAATPPRDTTHSGEDL